MLGCLIVFGLIVLGVFAVGVLIGQSPALLNHDYDFFISRSRGYLPMMVVCYGFIVACWVLMAAGFTAAGVAIADLYQVGKRSGISGIPEGRRGKTGACLMTRVSEIAEHWFGLCRKAPGARVLPSGFGFLTEPACEGQPEGEGTGIDSEGDRICP